MKRDNIYIDYIGESFRQPENAPRNIEPEDFYSAGREISLSTRNSVLVVRLDTVQYRYSPSHIMSYKALESALQ